jgi:hypothetical protein
MKGRRRNRGYDRKVRLHWLEGGRARSKVLWFSDLPAKIARHRAGVAFEYAEIPRRPWHGTAS